MASEGKRDKHLQDPDSGRLIPKRKGINVRDTTTPEYDNDIPGSHGLPFHTAWNSLRRRCLPGGAHQRNRPTYVGCTIDPAWWTLSDFKGWHNVSHVSGWHLDKDLIVPGNKVYGPDTCAYVPLALNTLFTDHGAARGNCPQGVNQKHGKYQARLTVDGREKYLGCFATVVEAEDAYIAAKVTHVRSEAARYRLDERIDPRVIAGMLVQADAMEGFR